MFAFTLTVDVELLVKALVAVLGLGVALLGIRTAVKTGTRLRAAVASLVVSILSLMGWATARAHQALEFQARVNDYISAARQDPDSAAKNLQRALAYLRNHDMVRGSTAVLYDGPAEDVGEYYTRLKDAAEGAKGRDDSTMKIDQYLISCKVLEESTSQEGIKKLELKAPMGISAFPHNRAYFLWALASLLGVTLAGVWTLHEKGRAGRHY